MFISLTRLRLRHWWYYPEFFVRAEQTARQAQRAPGFLGGFTLLDRRRTFWTMTGWDSEKSMRAYRSSGAHKPAMAKLPNWCDEASVAHWQAEQFPDWLEAWERMKRDGRSTPVRFPSPAHREKRIDPPRTQPLMQRVLAVKS